MEPRVLPPGARYTTGAGMEDPIMQDAANTVESNTTPMQTIEETSHALVESSGQQDQPVVSAAPVQEMQQPQAGGGADYSRIPLPVPPMSHPSVPHTEPAASSSPDRVRRLPQPPEPENSSNFPGNLLEASEEKQLVSTTNGIMEPSVPEEPLQSTQDLLQPADYAITPVTPHENLANGIPHRNSMGRLASYDTLPEFTPAPAFSGDDRGPYPPITTNKRRSAGSSHGGTAALDGLGGLSFTTPLTTPTHSGSPTHTPNSAGMNSYVSKRKSREVMVDESGRVVGILGGNSNSARSRPSSIVVVPGMPVPSNAGLSSSPLSTNARRRSQNVNNISPQTNRMSGGAQIAEADNGEGMAGVGRQSLLRNSGSSAVKGAEEIITDQPKPAQNGFAVNGRYPQPIAVPNLQPTQPLIPIQEFCVECMMRDQDMIDVDVTTPGVWDRESDRDFEEAMNREEASHRDFPVAGSSSEGSRESHRRLGRGQLLTTAGLKHWTSINPPASTHRWKTLHHYLLEQRFYLEQERLARKSMAAERERAQKSSSNSLSPPTPSSNGVFGMLQNRGRNSAVLPNGMIVENINVERDERKRRIDKEEETEKIRNWGRNSKYDKYEEYATPEQPWLEGKRRNSSSASRMRSSSPSSGSMYDTFGRSSADIRSIPSLRSLSPNPQMDDRRMSLWSKFRRASRSVYSFDPNGSMMDMHLGLSQDKHEVLADRLDISQGYDTYQNPVEQEVEKKKKKKGIIGFFNKLVSSGDEKRKRVASNVDPIAVNSMIARDIYYDDGELVPPPPLSALAKEPRYHNRSTSSSTFDSVPQALSHPRAMSTTSLLVPTQTSPLVDPSGNLQDQRRSSYNNLNRVSTSGLSQNYRKGSSEMLVQAPDVAQLYEDSNANTEVLQPQSVPLRREKSLPALPNEAYEPGGHLHFPRRDIERASIHTNQERWPSGDWEGSYTDSVTPSLRKGRTRSKVFSMTFGRNALNAVVGKKKRDDSKDSDTVVTGKALTGIDRDGGKLISVRF